MQDKLEELMGDLMEALNAARPLSDIQHSLTLALTAAIREIHHNEEASRAR